MQYTSEQMKSARKANLYNYLRTYHSDYIKTDGNSIHPKDNNSLSIKKGYSGYTDFATGEKGNSVDFLVKYLNYELTQAVLSLCDNPGATAPTVDNDIPKIQKDLEDAPFKLPEPAEGRYRQLFAYLMNRNIPAETIQMLIEQKILYQEREHNNMIFVNKEHDWAERRGTNTYADTRCTHRDKCDAFDAGENDWCIHMNSCSKYKKDSFHGVISGSRQNGFWWFRTSTKAQTAYICEAAIDAISLYLLNNKNEEHAYYISIGGVANQPTIDRIKSQSFLNKIVLAVDNDVSGQQCRDRNKDLDYIIPINKDWNEDLMALKKL